MWAKIKAWWDEVKAFFKYSETIFLARLDMLSGLVLATLGSLDYTDFTSIDFSVASAKQVTWLGIGIFIKGIVSEFVRRRNATFKSKD